MAARPAPSRVGFSCEMILDEVTEVAQHRQDLVEWPPAELRPDGREDLGFPRADGLEDARPFGRKLEKG